jgi:hypothetical protein
MGAIAQALTDKDFLAGQPEDQKAYLAHIDSDFAKGAPEEQNAYLNHILAPGRLAKAAQPTQFEKERQPENQEGFFHHAATTLGRQIGGIEESFNAPWKKGYETYSKQRARGEGYAPALAAGTARGLYEAVPGVKPTLELAQTVARAPEEYKKRRSEGYGPAYAAVAPPVSQAVGVNLPSMEHQADIGNTRGVMAEATVPAAEVLAAEGARAVGPRITRALEPGRIAAGREGLETALATPPGKAGARAAKMKSDIHVATADLAEIEKDTPAKVTAILKRGKGAENFHELAEKIDARQDKMWDEGHTPGIERHAEAPARMQQVAAAGKRLLTDEARTAAPQEAAAADAWLEGVAKDRNLKSLDTLVREINDDLKGKDASQRYGPLQVRVRQGVVQAARNEIERILTDSGEKGVKAVNRRWGALENIKGRLQERAVQEAQREAKQGPVPDWVHMYSFLHPDMGLSIGAGIAVGKLLRPNPATQLTKGMRQLGRTSLEAPYAAPAPPGWGAPPRGLLPAPAPQVEYSEPVGGGGGEAARQVYRDPATGRMQRGYTSEARYPAPEPQRRDVFTSTGGENRSLKEAVPERGESALDQATRRAAGENPAKKSVRRNAERRAKEAKRGGGRRSYEQ